MSIQQALNDQFGRYDNGPLLIELAVMLAPMGFEPDLWGNDSCPKLVGTIGARHFALWVDYKDIDCRDFAGSTITLSEYAGDNLDDWQADILETDSAREAYTYIETLTQGGAQ